MSKFKTVWFWDSGNYLDNGQKHVMSFYDDSYEKPSFVSGIKSPNHSSCHSFNSVDQVGRTVVNLVSDDFDGAAHLWYVVINVPNVTPHMKTIFAYADNRFPDGTLVGFDEVFDLGLGPSDSAGFVRWFVDDSRIQQIFVSPEHRRKRISTKLFSVADLLIVSAENWNGKFLNGGDITTDDGETLRAAWSNSVRVTDRVGMHGAISL